MPLREFRDATGVEWRVWDTLPTTPVFGERLPDGWLTFEANGNRRRLLHVPPDWASFDDDALRLLCVEARPEAPRRRLID
jgi:hypothetical protein